MNGKNKRNEKEGRQAGRTARGGGSVFKGWKEQVKKKREREKDGEKKERKMREDGETETEKR